MKVVAENRLDLSRAFGMSNCTIVDGVHLVVEVESDATAAELAEIERLTKERCPGVECVTGAVPLETSVRSPGR